MKHAVFLEETVHGKDFRWDTHPKAFTDSTTNMFLDWVIFAISENDVTGFYKWIQENITGEWTMTSIPYKNITSHFIFFDKEEDAMAFKLRWL